MTSDELLDLENCFGVALPPDYRSLLLHYPTELPKVVRGYELLDNASMIKHENKSVREGPLWGVTWPAHYFVVGGDGAGNIYCIDTKNTPTPVLFFDHDDRSFREEASSIAAWLPQLAQLHAP